MRIVFMGSARWACPCLEAILTGRDELVAVVTQPDRRAGRDLRMASCPAKMLAEQRGIPVLTPEHVNDSGSLEALRALKPDLIVVVAYGQILKRPLLDLPLRGCINVHGSLLPKYRGAAPIQWAIVRGEKEAGVTTMLMNERMDAGDILLQESMAIAREDTAGTLQVRLAALGGVLLVRTLDVIRQGAVRGVPQVEAEATPAPKLGKKDGRMDWTAAAEDLYNAVRGFNPWPCCFCEAPRGAGRWLKVLRSRVEEPVASAGRQAGEVLDVAGEGPLVLTGDGVLRLTEVQPEGRKAMSGGAYLSGHALKRGDVLG